MLDLIYWRDPKKSGAVFAATLAFLICLATQSIVTVFAYTGLVLLAATVSLKTAKLVMDKMGKDPTNGKVTEIQ